jgi:hypothetical protein
MTDLCGGEAAYPLIILFGLNAVDELDRTAFGILLPEIRESFDINISTALSIVALSSIAALALQVPIAQYADKSKRIPLVVVGALAWGDVLGHDRPRHGADPAHDRPVGVLAGQGGHRPDPQLPDRRLLPDRDPVAGLQLPPRRQRRRRVRRPAERRDAGVLLRLAGAVPGVRRPDGDLRGARVADEGTDAWPVGTSGHRRVTGHHRHRGGVAVVRRELATAHKVQSLQRIWWSLPFLATSLIGFVTLAALLYEQKFGLDERGRGVAAAVAEPFALVGLVIGARIATRRFVGNVKGLIRFVATVALLTSFASAGFAFAPNIYVAVALNCVISASLAIIGPGVLAALSLAIPPRARATGFAIGSLWVIPGCSCCR